MVAARSGAFPELIEDGRTGLLFTPGDADDLARALERLLTDPGLRQRLGAAGRRHIAMRFSVDTMTGRFLAACGEATSC